MRAASSASSAIPTRRSASTSRPRGDRLGRLRRAGDLPRRPGRQDPRQACRAADPRGDYWRSAAADRKGRRKAIIHGPRLLAVRECESLDFRIRSHTAIEEEAAQSAPHGRWGENHGRQFRAHHFPAAGARHHHARARPVADGSADFRNVLKSRKRCSWRSAARPSSCRWPASPWSISWTGSGARGRHDASWRQTPAALRPTSTPSGRRRRGAQHHADGDQFSAVDRHPAADRQLCRWSHFMAGDQAIPLQFSKVLQCSSSCSARC